MGCTLKLALFTESAVKKDERVLQLNFEVGIPVLYHMVSAVVRSLACRNLCINKTVT